jgi:hypothetical protein
MVGIARRIQSGPITNLAKLKHEYDTLMQDPHFKAAISSRTTDEAQVQERLARAVDAFRDVP